MPSTRREALIGAAALTFAANARADAPSPSTPTVAPLPFAPAKLRGLSETLLVSHHDVNYAGAVKNLAKVREQIASLPKDAPPFLVAGLRERELTFGNSKALHEAYFENLGGDGKPAGEIARALSTSQPAWEELMRGTAMSQAGGSGWTTLSFDLATGALCVVGAMGHAQAPASSVPLLVLDMFEHAYAMDYGAAAAKYVDAFFANVRWEVVDDRFVRAKKAFAALRG